MNEVIPSVRSGSLVTDPQELEWKSWDASDPDIRIPFPRTISIYRDKTTGIRYGIYFAEVLPLGYHVRDTGTIEVAIPGEEKGKNIVFTQWMSAHSLFGVVSFLVRAGLKRPPQDWPLPKWVSDLFLFHEGKTIPSSYMSNANFDYFSQGGEESIIIDL